MDITQEITRDYEPQITNDWRMVLDWAIETGEIYENVNDLKVDLQVVVDWFKAGCH